jgi:transmembrane sensor
MHRLPQFKRQPIATQAAAWLAKRDRGLSPAEERSYQQWLAADPAHAAAVLELERAWQFCDRLQALSPADGRLPDPDLLAPQRRFPTWSALAATAAGIAALLLLSVAVPRQFPATVPDTAATQPAGTTFPALGQSTPQADPSTSPATSSVAATAQIQRLADGSEISFGTDAVFDVVFSELERRIRLHSGEAFFNVAHNPQRPFVVETAGVTVQALGTAFKVSVQQFDVAVEVTEGSVEVRKDSSMMHADFNSGLVLAGGEKVVVRYRRLIPHSTPALPGEPTP